MKWLKKGNSKFLHRFGACRVQSCGAALLVIVLTGVPASTQAVTSVESCIFQIIQTAPDGMTIGEAREECSEKTVDAAGTNNEDKADKTAGVVAERLSTDDTNILKPFTLMAHNPNYILLAAHNFQGWSSEEFEGAFNEDSIDFDDTEAQFQLSIKTPLAINMFDTGVDIFAAYTVRSFWQVYNHDISSPFRETNHEPETWLQMRPEWGFLGFKNMVNVLGISHQSNGKAGSLSRSWNRVYAGFGFERGNFAFLIKPWIRIQEDFETDDNPDITDYMGHGEIGMAYKYKNHNFSLMSRNNLESGFSRGAIELGWSFPLFGYDYLKGYIQYFSGYGESLIDYNQYVNRIGLGLLLTDVL
jgi:phospholipase A1